MTLIACLHPHQCRTLIADALITSPKSPRDELVFPTKAYISPHKIQNMELKPVALRRKVIEINPNLIALWAGDLEHARRFADRAAAYFDGEVVEEDNVKSFLRDHYSQHVPNFHAIVVPSDHTACRRQSVG
jgi:hypothetical protein